MTKDEWLDQSRKSRYPWATDEQWQCILMLFDWERGEHHLTAKIKPFSRGVEYNRFAFGDLSTYDSDNLTRLVFLAHDRCIRVEIASSAPGRVRVICHKRTVREGGEFYQRHPSLEMAIAQWREKHEEPHE